MVMNKRLRVGILLAGETGVDMQPQNPSYQMMFEEFFSPIRHAIEISFIHTRHGDFPVNISDYDAYLISGSRHGVYDDLPWIPRLIDFVKTAYQSNIPLIGVCFGHQLLAHALGGEAVLSDKGWGVGVKKMALQANLPNSISSGSLNIGQPIRLLYMHQDQVIRLPDDALPLLGDEFCPYAGFIIPHRVLSFQGHPEFTSEYLGALIERRSSSIGNDKAEAAKKSLNIQTDNDHIRDWMFSFLSDALNCHSRVA